MIDDFRLIADYQKLRYTKSFKEFSRTYTLKDTDQISATYILWFLIGIKPGKQTQVNRIPHSKRFNIFIYSTILDKIFDKNNHFLQDFQGLPLVFHWGQTSCERHCTHLTNSDTEEGNFDKILYPRLQQLDINLVMELTIMYIAKFYSQV